MRLFEILIYLLLVMSFVGRLIPKLRKIKIFNYLSIASIVLIGVHLFTEGYRWQMVPAYIFTVVFVVVSAILIAGGKEVLIKSKVLRGIITIVSLIVVLISIIFPALLRVVDLPVPSGPYEIGTVTLRMVDENRDEYFTAEDDDVRSLLVRVWYPAEIEKEMKQENYWDTDGITGRAYSINADMGTFWYSHLAVSKTNSYLDANLSDAMDKYPVIIYSPSFFGMNTENTMLCEELASNGYIVFSLTHSYETIVSIYPDGEVVYGDLSHFNTLYDDNYEAEVQLYEDYNDADNVEGKTEILSEIFVVDESTTQMIKIRTEDILFVLDEIEKMNTESNVFMSKIDMENIGVAGWSFGGASAEEAMMLDDRIKAAVNMDGWPYGENFGKGASIAKPFMLFNNGEGDEMDEIVGNILYSRASEDAYRIIIEDTTHINFWDFPMLLKVYKHIGYWGTQDPDIMNDIHKNYTVKFFDKYLMGEDVDIVENADKNLPIVNVESKNID